MNEGWVCPKCGSVYAPFVQECHRCNGIMGGYPKTIPEIGKPYMPPPYGTGVPYPDPNKTITCDDSQNTYMTE